MAAPGRGGPAKGNSGWGDPKALAAARELAQSFKSSGGKSQGQTSSQDTGGRSGASSFKPPFRGSASRREQTSDLSNTRTDHKGSALDRGQSTRETQRSVNQRSFDREMESRPGVQRPSGRKIIAGDAMTWLKATTSGKPANENIKDVATQPAKPTPKAAASTTVPDSTAKQDRHSTAQSRDGPETRLSRLQIEREIEERKKDYISAKLNCLTAVPSASHSARSATPQDAQSLSASSAQADRQSNFIEAITNDNTGAMQVDTSQSCTARTAQLGRDPRDVLNQMLGRLEKDPAYFKKLAAGSASTVVTGNSVSEPTASTTTTTTAQPTPSQTLTSQSPPTQDAILQEARSPLGMVATDSQHLKASSELKQSIGSNASIVTAFKELKLEDKQKSETGPTADTQPDSVATVERPVSASNRSEASKQGSSKRSNLLPPSVKGWLLKSSPTSPVVATDTPSVASKTRDLNVSKTSPEPGTHGEAQESTGVYSIQEPAVCTGTQQPHPVAAPARKRGPGLESSMFNHMSSKADQKNASTGLNARSEPFISSITPSTNESQNQHQLSGQFPMSMRTGQSTNSNPDAASQPTKTLNSPFGGGALNRMTSTDLQNARESPSAGADSPTKTPAGYSVPKTRKGLKDSYWAFDPK